METKKIMEERVKLGQRVYRNLIKNEFIGDGKKISRVNRFTQLLAQFAKSIALSHKALFKELMTDEEKTRTVLDLLDKAQGLDQLIDLNQNLWESYHRNVIEMQSGKLRKRGSVDSLPKYEDLAAMIKNLIFDPLHNNCKNFFE